jgi:hypothetical protein
MSPLGLLFRMSGRAFVVLALSFASLAKAESMKTRVAMVRRL